MNLDSCKRNSSLQDDYDAIKNYSDTVMYYKDRYGNSVAYNKSLEVSEKALLSAVSGLEQEVSRLKLKSLRNVTKVVTEARIDTVMVGFNNQLPCDSFSEDFDTSNRFFHLYGTVNNKGILFGGILMPDSIQLITSTKKNGLFKRNEMIVTINHSNPYVKTTGLQNYAIKPPARNFSIGPSLTYGLTLPDLKPTLVGGISIQYRLIRF